MASKNGKKAAERRSASNRKTDIKMAERKRHEMTGDNRRAVKSMVAKR